MAELNLIRQARRIPTRVQAAVLIAAVALVLTAAVIASQMASSSMAQLAAAAAKAREQSEAASEVINELQQAESGQRGYLITRRPSYLERYERGTQLIGPDLELLNHLAQGTPWLQDDAAKLTEAVRIRLAELADAVRLFQMQGVAPSLSTILSDAGRTEMDAARTTAAHISRRADADRDTRTHKLQARQRTINMIMLAALCVGFLLLVAAALRLVWSRAALLQARDAERLEAARLHAAVEHIRDGLAVFDAKDQLTLQNSRFASTLGLPESQFAPGTTLAAIAAEAAMDPPVLSGPGPGARPVMTETRQGSRILEVWRSAMPDDGQIVAVADISRRVQAEAIARQAQKMEMIGQMTGGIAHDFNNLLQVISANLEMVAGSLAGTNVEPVVMDRLESASLGAARGAQLTRHLLAFARRQPLAPEALDPARLLMSMEDMLRRTLGEAIELKLIVASGLWAMRADPAQLESALLNLALNARDAMLRSDGVPAGRITIEVGNDALDETFAGTHEEVEPGEYLMFAVSDNGCGMSPDQLARALEPFYTTKPDGKGTGLGLPMVFGFAKQSGGHFQLYSELGCGTTARLYIPRTTAAIEAPPPRQPVVRAAQGELVLLVEDDVSVRRVAADALHMLGYTVHEAGNGDEALALLEAGIRPAVLFTDVVMPGATTSRELAIRAQAMVPGLAVLFTSGYTAESVVHNGALQPGISLISKPWRTEDLGRALRAAVDAVRPPAAAIKSGVVLLVEDEALVRMTTADALSDLGFQVLEAATGASALDRLQSPPDLMLTDLGLPDMDGMELIARARTVVPGLPVVVATGRAEPPDADVVFLTKPYNGRDLREAIEKAIHAKVLAGP